VRDINGHGQWVHVERDGAHFIRLDHANLSRESPLFGPLPERDAPALAHIINTWARSMSAPSEVVVHVSVNYAAAQDPRDIAQHVRALVDECAARGVTAKG